MVMFEVRYVLIRIGVCADLVSGDLKHALGFDPLRKQYGLLDTVRGDEPESPSSPSVQRFGGE